MSDPDLFYSSGRLSNREEFGIFCKWIKEECGVFIEWIKNNIKDNWGDCCAGLLVIGIIIGWITGLCLFYQKEDSFNFIDNNNIIPQHWIWILIWLWPCLLIIGSAIATIILWLLYEILAEISKLIIDCGKSIKNKCCSPVESFRKYRSAEHFRRTGQPTNQV